MSNETETHARSGVKRFGVGATIAGLVAGTAAGLVFAVPTLTSAADSDSTDVPAFVVDGDDARRLPSPADRAAHLRERLEALVGDGTITAAQADAVAEHLAANPPERRPGEHRQRGAFGGNIAEILGIDQATLRAELQSGKTLAEVAADNGVDAQTLIDGLIAQAQAHLDQAVADGKMTADEAAEKLANIETRITDRLNVVGAPGS